MSNKTWNEALENILDNIETTTWKGFSITLDSFLVFSLWVIFTTFLVAGFPVWAPFWLIGHFIKIEYPQERTVSPTTHTQGKRALKSV